MRYLDSGMMRWLHLLLISLSVLVAPLAMAAAGPAHAAGMAIDAAGHCLNAEPAPSSGPSHPDGGIACAAACAAVPGAQPRIAFRHQPTPLLPSAARLPALRGIQLEGDTPPPRS